jgi:hypothetical protein
MFQPAPVFRPAMLAALLVSFTPFAASGQDLPASKIKSAQGKAVRVTEADGTERTGKLTSFTAAGLALQDKGQDVTIPLPRVRKVEKVAHGVRWGVIVGAATGAVYGYGVTEEDLSGSSREVIGAVILGGIGAAAGAGVGLLINRARRGGNLVYESGSGSRTVSVAPLLDPSGAIGVSLRASW